MSSSDYLKSSAHVWGGNGNQQPPDSPPAYSGNDENGPELPPRLRADGPRRNYDPIKELGRLSAIPFSKYNIQEATSSPDKTIITTTDPQLLLSPQALSNFLLEQAELPPIPTVRILGTHLEAVAGNPKIDFDLTLNLAHLIDFSGSRWRIKTAQSEPLPGNSRDYGRGSSSLSNQSPIALWAIRFCKEKAEHKSLTLTRSVPNLPTEIIEGQIRTMLASLKYRGRVTVSFPVQHSKVVVYKQGSNWLISMLRIYPEKKYDIIETIWEVSSASEASSSSDSTSSASGLAKDWWSSWMPVVRNAILARKRGKIGVDDWIETQMGNCEKEPTLDWGQDRG